MIYLKYAEKQILFIEVFTMDLLFKGLILAYCPDCKKITVFGSKDEAKGFVCNTCHNFKPFLKVATGVSCTCECGQYIKAVTNCEENIFEFNCKCGYPLTVEYNRRKEKYFGLR